MENLQVGLDEKGLILYSTAPKWIQKDCKSFIIYIQSSSSLLSSHRQKELPEMGALQIALMSMGYHIL